MLDQQVNILLNTFLMKKKRYRILLNLSNITWEKENNSKKGTQKTVVPLTDVIAVRQFDQRVENDNGDQSATPGPGPQQETTPNLRGKQAKEYLIIDYAKRIIKSPQDCNRWRRKTIILYNSELRVVTQWCTMLQKLIKEQNRVRNMLVFINPYGGRKRGLVTYEKYCKPLFQLANIEASCIISQRANQIHDIMMRHNLNEYDAVCCVGGDGTFAEMVNGLMFRTIKDAGLDTLKPSYMPKPSLAIGVIPAGSTDTIAYSLHGTHDVITAAIHVVLSQKRGLDICSVENGNGLIRFCASILSYGYLGDIASESENYRWMGTKRYEYTGFKTFLANTGYQAEIRVLQSANSASVDDANSLEIIDGEKCYVDCSRCLSSNFSEESVDQKQPTDDNNENKNTTSASTSVSTNEPEIVALTQFTKTSSNCDSMDVIPKEESELYQNSYDFQIGTSSLSPSPKIWKTIKGKYFMISGANITCACARSPNGMSKYCHLGDGRIDLILVRKTTFLNNVRLLLTMTSKHGDIRNLPFVEIYRTSKFCFRMNQNEEFSWNGSCQPINQGSQYKTSLWNCDGEVIHDLDITMTSHCQLLNVFMRGPYPFQKDKSSTSCCAGFCKP